MFKMSSQVAVRTSEQLDLMRKSGIITAKALKKVIEESKAGVSLVELDTLAENEIMRLGGKPSFKTVEGYSFTTCLTINDEVVHGLPRQIKLMPGDVLSVDLGTVYDGWHTDAAWSVIVGWNEEDGLGSKKREFLKVGDTALWQAIEQAVEDKRIGDISAAIQTSIEGGGYNVVRSLVGHGIGRSLHEEPEVPGFGLAGTGVMLKAGMTLAIEVIYTAGGYKVESKDDGWTIVTADGALAALFEMSVIVGKEEAEVLTDWRRL